MRCSRRDSVIGPEKEAEDGERWGNKVVPARCEMCGIKRSRIECSIWFIGEESHEGKVEKNKCHGDTDAEKVSAPWPLIGT